MLSELPAVSGPPMVTFCVPRNASKTPQRIQVGPRRVRDAAELPRTVGAPQAVLLGPAALVGLYAHDQLIKLMFPRNCVIDSLRIFQPETNIS